MSDERTTRRNPEMERYTVIKPAGGEFQVWLKVGVQSFPVGVSMETMHEAEFIRDMLCIALASLLMDCMGLPDRISSDKLSRPAPG